MHACMKDILIKCVSPPLSNPYSFPISYVLFLKPTKSAQCYQYRCGGLIPKHPRFSFLKKPLPVVSSSSGRSGTW